MSPRRKKNRWWVIVDGEGKVVSTSHSTVQPVGLVPGLAAHEVAREPDLTKQRFDPATRRMVAR
jgi:hypothetical protein